MLSDHELMQRIQAGETGLFAELAQRYRPRLTRFARSAVPSGATAEDFVQEVLLAAFSARDSYRPAFAFSTWIWTIALNLGRRWRQRAAVRQQSWANWLLKTPGTGTQSAPAVAIQQLEHREELELWLSQLPEAYADAIRLRFFGELSFEEIALAMQSSVSGAKARVRKGLEQLAELARAAAG